MQQENERQQTPPGNTNDSDDPNVDAWGQKGTPGMLGAMGSSPHLDSQAHGAPIGVPEEPGSGPDSAGVTIPYGDMGTGGTPKNLDVLGTAGNVGHATQANLEPGTPGVPGTPVPAPMGGQLASGKVADSAGPETPSPENEGLGATPTPPGIGQGDETVTPNYGGSGTPGLGGAHPTDSGQNDSRQASQDDETPPRRGHGVQNNNPGTADETRMGSGDDAGLFAKGSAGDAGGAGVRDLGGSPGGTPNYGGVGVPGGAQTLGHGFGNGPDTHEGGTLASPGLGVGENAAAGQSPVHDTRVLPGGATRASGTNRDTGTNYPDPTLADDAYHTSSTGGSLQPHRSEPPGGLRNQFDTRAEQKIPEDAGGPKARTSDSGVVYAAGPDEIHGTGAGAAANDVARGDTEAATLARSDSGQQGAGSPPPEGAPPPPATPNPYGGTGSESQADPTARP